MSVSSRDKGYFIEHFMKTYKVQSKECGWILNYIACTEKMLEKVHFVESITGYENAFIMSAECEYEKSAFAGIISGSTTHDPAKMLHFIRLNGDDEIYIQINFANRMQDSFFVAVLEENEIIEAKTNKQDIKLAKDFIAHSLQKFRPTELLIKIDLAIESGDKSRFMELSKQYKEMISLERKSKETS